VNENVMTRNEADLGLHPEHMIELSTNEIYGIPLQEQVSLQLKAAQTRFGQLIDRIPMLTRLAEEQGFT
jgi:hypothetical protein